MSLEPSELFPEVPNLYEFPSVHLDMLCDERRLNAYRAAIERVVRPGDIVVDVGTGTGILAFMCLDVGAAHVHAIERSAIIDAAREHARENGYSDRMSFYNNDSRQTELPVLADVLVSELIGHIVFEEGMTESLIDARKRFLKPAGSVIPKKAVLMAAPVHEKDVYGSCIEKWLTATPYRFTAMHERALSTAYLVDLSQRDLLAEPASSLTFDVENGSAPDSHVEVPFTLSRTGVLNGFALWFDAELTKGVPLSSAPWSRTHWKQCFAPIWPPIQAESGRRVTGLIDIAVPSQLGEPFLFRLKVEETVHA